MSELKLLNCPFCNGKAEFVKMGIAKDIPLGFVRCTECGIRLRQVNFTENFARDEWNRRTPMANILEKLEEAKEEYRDYDKNGKMFYELTASVTGLNKAITIVKQEINNGLE